MAGHASNPDLEFDFTRRERLGFPEIVYGEAKSVDQLQRIVSECREKSHPILISRCQPEKAAALTGGDYDPVARTWRWQNAPPPSRKGKVAVLSGGTADAPVVAECSNVLSFLGLHTQSFQDVGVASVQRFLKHLPELEAFDVLIVVAGFEGALASVVAGQCPQPVIGVPTSVGYGVAAQGVAALHAMLASCANGLMVMNVDNGVGAALAAGRILR
jgi:pyridinium-3,5-biscarboxylic acid mononucleotide synthase